MIKAQYTFEMPCNGLTKGFPEIGKRLTECDIPNEMKRHRIIHSSPTLFPTERLAPHSDR